VDANNSLENRRGLYGPSCVSAGAGAGSIQTGAQFDHRIEPSAAKWYAGRNRASERAIRLSGGARRTGVSKRADSV